MRNPPQVTARQLTWYDADDRQEITDVSFTHDAKWILYVRGGGPNQAGELPNPTSDPAGVKQAVWIAAWDTGEAR